MTERWIEYFAKGKNKYYSSLEYAIDHWSYNAPLYRRIKNLITPPAKILEVGCGLGFSSIYLSSCGYKMVGIDNDNQIINEAKENSRNFKSKANFEQGDAFNLSKYYGIFDLVFSAGVVEHFLKEKTIQLLQEQAKCASYVIAVIPTKYTKYVAPITDERIYNVNQLTDIFKRAGIEVIKKFGYGDIPTLFHKCIRTSLPYAIYYTLQNNFSYAMQICCIGKSNNKK